MAKKVLDGIPVSAGVAIGRAYFLNRGHYCLAPIQSISEEWISEEVNRLRAAFDRALQHLKEVKSKVPQDQTEHLAIIDYHIMILQDPKFRESTERYIREMCLNAEWALEKGIAEVENAFNAIEDDYLQARVEEVRLLGQRVMDQLLENYDTIKPITTRVILIAHNLTPADTVELDVSKIMAFSTARGGKTSHVAILARSLEIPAVVGVENLEGLVEDGEYVIVDAFQGKIIIDPSGEELEYYTNLKEQFESYQREVMQERDLPSETLDGFSVCLFANIELFEEVSAVIDYAGEGVGLYRTEYSYLYNTSYPTEQELMEEYRDLASILYPKRLIIRTLDAGGDKVAKDFETLEEANPVLGLRAVRFCLKYKEMFKTQLRAILRSSQVGNVSLMFPMVSGVGELRDAKKVLEEVKEDLRSENIAFDENLAVGIVVELPSTVMIADILAREVDFFSIGTNDLIQYSLGIDRTNMYVSHLYQPLHPALLRSIKYVVDAGHKAGIEVSMCGEMASDTYCLPVLIGMQVDSLSLNPQAIPGIKRVLRKLTLDECSDLLKKVLESDSVQVNNRLIREKIYKRFPEELIFYSSMLEQELI